MVPKRFLLHFTRECGMYEVVKPYLEGLDVFAA
jgi:hypothetical protein